MPPYSLFRQYAGVRSAPRYLREFVSNMKPGNARTVLDFAIKHLPQAELGRRHCTERIVRFAEPMWWRVGPLGELRSEVPTYVVDCAVVSASTRLRECGFPFQIGRRCYGGDPRSSYFKPVVSYVVGLVDLSQPLGPGARDGSGAV